jgi:signal recognition particle receptor subunit beta
MANARANMVRKQRATNGKVNRPLKIVITGPFAAGKTTLIKTISEVSIVGTERDVTDETRSVKTRTTVAMDFGRLSFGDDLSLFLFGTPGQRRFEVMWEILSEGMIGFICLVNASDERSLEESSHILDQFRQYADVPFVIGISHLDEQDEDHAAIFSKVRQVLEVPETVEVIAVDPREREDVKTLMLHILMGVLSRLDKTPAAAQA